ncbi:hypothetical protein JAAARDRAFT_28127 [Jaapia argillacea MUCL 33604]|uniref:Peptidase A1 domain-containing protein n=1 Tax=Jaapia argillacea MUCL 33604 TaxID=933084 RepID=A0A067QBR3_9AGAM|nr:hypothetical protein JAAARDRAFT_28127 [Jaapia argillacea MUCL 33604]
MALNIPISKVKRSPRSAPLQRRSGNMGVTASQPGVLAAAAASGNGAQLDLSTVHDLIYIANVSVGGNQYSVQLDTGSSDLWIQGPVIPLPNTNQTTLTHNLTYGIGWAYGHISYASVDFAGIHIPTQALLDVSSANNPALSYGANGILGLGFTSLSTIDAVVNGTGSSAGRSLLYNAFLDNPSEPNYLAFSLQRSTEPNDPVQGTFSIGETDPTYAAVLQQPAVSTWPVNSPSRWNVLLDGIIMGGTTIPVTSTIPGAPSGKAVVLLDSGTSYTYASTDVCQAIYGSVPGAQFDTSLGQWVVPCSAEIDIAIQIGGQIYPIHPLDMTPPGLADPTTCVGSFVPSSVAVGAGQFDWLMGDNILRSVYSIYDFGDFDSSGKMGNPYVKLLSIVDPNEASVEFHSVRGGTPRSNITYNASNSTTGSPTTTVSLSQDVANTIDTIGKYFPAMLAVIGLNAVVLLILAIIAIVYMCQKRKRRGANKTRRSTPGRLTPMPMHPMDDMNLPPTHSYQPVSMALTEDTYVPSSPGYRKDFDRDSMMAPKSILQRPTSIADSVFAPPAPAFMHGESSQRPMSVA